MKIGVVVNTYQRPDGKTKFFLTRCLNSIKSQIHQDFKVFLIGDKYDDESEFLEISTGILPNDKIHYENLEYAKEREKYLNGDKLWCSGGVNSRNIGIKKCLDEGLDFICNIDHDDQWLPNHLYIINKLLEESKNYPFISTKTNYRNLYSVPVHSSPGEFLPVPGDITHSATCINFSQIPLRYRDVFEETGVIYPADADLWTRITNYLLNNNQSGFLIDEVTVVFDKKERE